MQKYFISFILLLFTSTYAQNIPIKEILGNLSESDRQDLTQLFSWVVQRDHLSYTLFGDKAITLSGHFIKKPSGNIFAGYASGELFWKYWKVWKDHEYRFPIKNYLIVEEPSITVPEVMNIIFINKKAFVEKVNEHIKFFKKRLGNELTAEDLLKIIEDKRSFAPIIKNDETLWGILLGYGVHNSRLYDRKCKLEQFTYLKKLPKQPLKKPTSREFSSIEEEFNFLESKSSAFGDYEYSPLIQEDIHFMADSAHPETKALEKKYRELRGRISAIYSKGDFLEITLSKLTSKD